MIELQQSQLVTRSSEAALNLAVDAYKSLISDYTLRTKQAEEMTAILLSEKLTSDQLFNIAIQTMGTHIRDKANERAIHQQQVLQATKLAIHNLTNLLNTTRDKLDLETIQGTVNMIAKGLTIALGNMNNFAIPRTNSTNPSDSSPMENS